MTDKTSTKGAASKTPSLETSGSGDKVTGKPPQSDVKVPADKNKSLPGELGFFMLELYFDLEAINKLKIAAHAEFDRITEDDVSPNNMIDPNELLEMNSFLELLPRELQRLGQKAQTMAGRFRSALLDAGVDAAELEERTKKKQQDWQSVEAERLKEVAGRISEKEMAICTQMMLTLTALCKLHEILGSIRDGHGPFDRVDRLAVRLAKEIVTIMEHFDGGDLWRVIRAQQPK